MEEVTDTVPAIGVPELLERLPKYHTISCISKRNSGKSVIVSQIIQEQIKAKKQDTNNKGDDLSSLSLENMDLKGFELENNQVSFISNTFELIRFSITLFILLILLFIY